MCGNTSQEDADTTSAVYSQLAGAYYDEPGIPGGWINRLALRDKGSSFADEMLAFSQAEGRI